ncbi:MAG: sortase [Candidatus Sungbacteria bacterium]|uniref:Sortase n=1 Tax=Candidatus Sungiibacteriota bacterium TaxID=2750080 RepID=A0A933DT37_9BACT|nr:sortase [Candidatus Sungbacteria bacterium]
MAISRFDLYSVPDSASFALFTRFHSRIIGGGVRPGQRLFVFSRQFLAAWFAFTVVFLAVAYGVGVAPAAVSELGDRIVTLLSGGDVPDEPIRPAAVGGAGPRIIVPTIGIAAPIVFPESASLDALNMALLRGVAHYPGSALPGDSGTVFLFGHSTGLAVVNNKNFEVFNRVSELAAGDTIRLHYGGREYWYRVQSIELKRTDAAVIDLTRSSARRLVLTTCNVFGGLDDRFIVTAEFVGSYPLSSGRSTVGSSS